MLKVLSGAMVKPDAVKESSLAAPGGRVAPARKEVRTEMNIWNQVTFETYTIGVSVSTLPIAISASRPWSTSPSY